MEAEFGERYLRYVDDIVIVSPREQVRSAVGRLRALLDAEGLSLNDDKQDIVDAEIWQTEGWEPFAQGGVDSFDELLQDIFVFLLGRPSRAEALHAELRREGFALPIARFAGQSRSLRHRSFFRRAVRDGRRLLAWMRGFAHNERSILEKAQRVRAELWAAAGALATAPPQSAMRRRWFAQRRRSTYNRLLYLLPPNQYQSLLAIIPEIDEFHEVRAVTAALASGDVTGILPFPGKIVTTFCQIWSEQHPGRQPRIRWPNAPGRADAETAANLALKVSVIPSADVLEAIGRHTPGARMLIELCCQSATDRSKITSLTYLDEMENLFRGVPHEDTQRLLTRRFDELEDVGLEALALGAGGYPMAWDLCNYAN
jgi:hypothetical protein